MRVTYYRRTLDPTPHGVQLSWRALADDMCRYRDVGGDKGHRLAECPLWAPHVIRQGGRRCAAHTLEVTALVLDYDDGVDVRTALARWEPYRAVAYTTWSHTPDAPRCRLVLPLKSPVTGSVWSAVYRAQRDAGSDGACCDPSRAYYVPSLGVGGPHQSSRRLHGPLLDLTDVANETERARVAAEAERKARAERARREVAEVYARADGVSGENRRLLRDDPTAREDLALALGADIRDNGVSRKARRVPCPACGRPAVWWAIEKGWAKCNHRNSCGWEGPLHQLATLTGG